MFEITIQMDNKGNPVFDYDKVLSLEAWARRGATNVEPLEWEDNLPTTVAFNNVGTALTSVDPDDGDGNTPNTTHLDIPLIVNIPTQLVGPDTFTLTSPTTITINRNGVYRFKLACECFQSADNDANVAANVHIIRNGVAVTGDTFQIHETLAAMEGSMLGYVDVETEWILCLAGTTIRLRLDYLSNPIGGTEPNYEFTVTDFSGYGTV
jgi:hypothetical protein